MSRIMTVRGPIPPSEAGITLPHEHLLFNGGSWLVEPLEPSKAHLVKARVTAGILNELRTDPYSCEDNLVLDDVEGAIGELERYRMAGGSTLVELTPPGVGRDPSKLRKVSEASGVNVVCATGWYIAGTHPSTVRDLSVSGLADIMIRELSEGIDDLGIRAGVIKIGFSHVLHPDEKKVLQAAALAQESVGAAVFMHTTNFDVEKRRLVEDKVAHECLDQFEAEGGDIDKTCVCHMDGTYYDKERDLDYHKSILDRGATIEYDQFGSPGGETIQCDPAAVPFDPNIIPGMSPTADEERVASIVELCGEGYCDQIMISHDVCTKTQWSKYGGCGYGYIPNKIRPSLARAGLSEATIDSIMVENPRRMLAF